jgi:hypothetical protein
LRIVPITQPSSTTYWRPGYVRERRRSAVTGHSPPRAATGTWVAIRTAYIDSAAEPPNDGATNPATGNIRQPLFHRDFSQYIIGRAADRPPTVDRDVRGGAAIAVSFAAEHCMLLET